MKKIKAKKDSEKAATISEIEAKYPKAKKTDSGIYYTITKAGKGEKPKNGQDVSLNFKLSLLSGMVLGASDIGGKPIEFKVGAEPVPGWHEVISDMTVGEKRTVVIPPELVGIENIDNVPPDSYLVFDMELVGIKK
ncbi:MAG: FKBP-type peptidyl-prolyl cis-trans isomerase [Spirochaetaceae bacterium]|nr:FKBP-type peptidyl-prolyl cis-trans isomerase [Spirochaetaceae bacterium]